ncbi:hypothetical protein E2C01_021153 [Portunus trituberculatus]|uniref:Uncharacterized protein n=1 Tax=Portunus trituberculatus TaxID=210409 RepID=A0A5B7E1Y6_PORTR|nr:hypothetical protein [Portunus trituberculatus]
MFNHRLVFIINEPIVSVPCSHAANQDRVYLHQSPSQHQRTVRKNPKQRKHLKQHRAERRCSMGAIDGTQCCPFHRHRHTLSLVQYCTVVLVRKQRHSINYFRDCSTK